MYMLISHENQQTNGVKVSHIIDYRPTEKGLETPQIYPGIDVTTELERVTVVR